ncbi:bifunctional diguanylate cyclase/phosphodiesterase, partial [Patulibacter sp.]|uniref:PAS domain-containing protein n=1 Tax=Patulibacter sp. TaxID=1912859 RepID=UPI00271A95D5
EGRAGHGVGAQDAVVAGAGAVRRAAHGGDALERAAGAADLVLSALESMTDVSILVFDRENRFCASAGSALKRHGYRHRDVVGRCAPDVLSADVWARLRPGYEAALRGGATTLVHRAADGAVYEIEFRPVRDDARVVGGIAISRDVTGRHGEGTRPTDAGELFELSFAHAPIAKALISPDGRWLRVNRRLCELLGRDEASLMRCGLQDLTHPDDVASDVGLGREVLDGLRTRYAVEKRYVHAAGHVVPTRLEVSLVRAADGRPRWFVFQFVALPFGADDRPRLPVATCAV